MLHIKSNGQIQRCPQADFTLRSKSVDFLHHFAGDLRADKDTGEGTGELSALFPVNSELPGNVGAELEVTWVWVRHIKKVYKS